MIRLMYGTTASTSVAAGSTTASGTSHARSSGGISDTAGNHVEHARGEQQDQRDPDHELRQRREHEAHRRARRGRPARSRFIAIQHADPDRERDRDQRGDEHEERGVGDARREQLGHRLLGGGRRAEAAGEHPVDPIQVLADDRVVQVELLAQRRDPIRGGLAAEDRGRRVARQGEQRAEHDQRDQPQGQEAEREPLEDQFAHDLLPFLGDEPDVLEPVVAEREAGLRLHERRRAWRCTRR